MFEKFNAFFESMNTHQHSINLKEPSAIDFLDIRISKIHQIHPGC